MFPDTTGEEYRAKILSSIWSDESEAKMPRTETSGAPTTAPTATPILHFPEKQTERSLAPAKSAVQQVMTIVVAFVLVVVTKFILN